MAFHVEQSQRRPPPPFHVEQSETKGACLLRDFAAELEAELAELTALGRRRSLPELSGLSRTSVQLGPDSLLSFCSNDYLGLSAHPDLAAAASGAGADQGWGASASRLVSGDLPAHRALEQALAHFLSFLRPQPSAPQPSVLLFPTGYQTNIGVMTAIAGRDDLVVSDALNHASLIDGCRLSRARIAVYPHGDSAAARALLTSGSTHRRRLLVTESLFSMDGDVAPLAQLAAVAAETDAVLVVDEAHALGVFGPQGQGLCAAAGVVPDVLIGTLGKAFGAAGGFAAGVAPLRDLLVNRARTFIYTTAIPPPVAAAALAALALIRGPIGAARRAVLDTHRTWLAAQLRTRGLLSRDPDGPIVPIILGSEPRALSTAAHLRSRGLFVPAIRPPTVPPGTARLRVTLSAGHRRSELERLVEALVEAPG
jgi:8-amino-7-oxononanoate synthase